MGTLLIVDGNEEFRMALAERLQGHYRVLCADNGLDALALLRRERPELLVTDLILPELDGLTMLERALREGICPKVLLAAPCFTDYVYASVEQLNIGYMVRKPCDMDALATRVLDLGSSLCPSSAKPDPEHLIRSYLLRLHFSPKHDGYLFLCSAIRRMLEQPGLQITKTVYPAVAKEYGRKARHVERSIRSAVECAWGHGDLELWRRYFPGADSRPSNAVFVSRIAAHIRQELE